MSIAWCGWSRLATSQSDVQISGPLLPARHRLRLPGSGWIRVGTTQGRGRYELKKNHYDKPKKDIWLQPLRKDWKRVHNRQKLLPVTA